MAFTKITANVQNISALGDEPNVDDGLSASQLKAKFDKAGVDIKAGVNNLIDELADTTAAANIGADALDVSDTSDNTVQDKLEYLQTEMQSITQGAVADGSITAAKLASDAVTTAKIDDGAVTDTKLDSSVTDLIDAKAEIAKSTYTGDGTYGSANPTTLTFTKAPKAVVLPFYIKGSVKNFIPIIITPEMDGNISYPAEGQTRQLNITWSNSNLNLEWYSTQSEYVQLNANGKIYPYIVIY